MRLRFNHHLFSLRIILVVLISTLNFSVWADRTYTLSRAPQLTPDKIKKDWGPFVNYLTEKTGVKIKLKVYGSRDKFQQDVKQGVPDFYYGNPGYCVVGNKLHNYRPLVRSDNKRLKGIIVARKDSNIKNVAQLNGKTIVYPGPNAFAASLYLRSQLSESEGVKFTPSYVKGHNNVYANVLSGKFVAGGGVYRTLKQEDKSVRDQLQVVYETPGLSPHPLTAHPRVPSEVSDKITKAILAMANDKEGKALLNRIKLKKPVKADYSRDCSPIEQVATEMYSSFFDVAVSKRN